MDDITSVPNTLAVFGSESAVIQPYIRRFATTGQVIRVYNKTHPKPYPNCRDVRDLDELSEILSALGSECPLKLAVVGVATLSQQKLFTQTTASERDNLIQTNIGSYLSLASCVLPHMIRHRFGRLVYLSSFRSQHHSKGTSIYSASKSFCETFFSSLGKEYGRVNVTTGVIRMGFFGGRMVDDLPPELVQKQLRQVALRRLGTSDELAEAIDFLVTNPYTNGGVLDLDGGIAFD